MAIKLSSQVLYTITTRWCIPHRQCKSRKFEKYREKTYH